MTQILRDAQDDRPFGSESPALAKMRTREDDNI